jgi:guanosine-3',5'-bis(diphosphate) 3'-pyrophosphohydrolase
MVDVIGKVKELATIAHGDQKRKYNGDPYVTHTFRVADVVKEHGGDDSQVMAAILHDVLEDTPMTEQELLEEMMLIVEPNIAIDVVRLVKELTDIFTHENYPEYNRKARKEMESIRMGKISPRSQTIKYADLLDNGKDIMKNDPKFGELYIKEKETILKYMNKGDSVLYNKCIEALRS